MAKNNLLSFITSRVFRSKTNQKQNVYSNILKRESAIFAEIEEKGFTGAGCYRGSSELGFGRPQSLAAYIAIDYYAKIQPVSSSINKITDELSSINPVVFDEQSDEIIYDHPVLSLLDNPNPFCKYPEFIKSLATDFLVTGNAFIICTGDIKSPAKEIYTVSPRNVYLDVGMNGYVNRIDVNTSNESVSFKLSIQNINGKRVARYLADSNREIFHIKNPNPFGQSYSPWGFSNLTPLVYEMEQYLHTNTHNLSLLVKGGRPSMFVSMQEQITQDQYDNISSQLSQYNTGSDNAGAIWMFPFKMDAKEMSMSNKDMDFENMRKSIIASIHTQLGVPLPLVMPDQMTLANMNAAMAQFYNSTVIPAANRIFSELTDLLMPRYKNEEHMDITFDYRSIPALEAAAVESVKNKAQLNVMSDNEIRTELGLEHIKGADRLYKPSGMLPIGSTVTSQQNLQQDSKPPVDLLIDRMKSIVNKNGDKIFSDERIAKIINKYK